MDKVMLKARKEYEHKEVSISFDEISSLLKAKKISEAIVGFGYLFNEDIEKYKGIHKLFCDFISHCDDKEIDYYVSKWENKVKRNKYTNFMICVVADLIAIRESKVELCG